MERLKHQRDTLYQEAQQHPDSEAGQILQAFVLAGMMGLEAGSCDASLALGFSEQRQRYRADEDRTEQAAAQARPDFESRGAPLEVTEIELRLRKVTEEAAKAAAGGKPMDERQICRRIAEIVGLSRPSLGGATSLPCAPP